MLDIETRTIRKVMGTNPTLKQAGARQTVAAH